MTIKRKRFKNYAEAEDAAVRAARQCTAYARARALKAVLENVVTWVERPPFKVGIAYPNVSDGGVAIVVEQTTTHVKYDVWYLEDWIDAYADLQPLSRDPLTQKLRSLSHEVAMVRNRLIAQAEGMG